MKPLLATVLAASILSFAASSAAARSRVEVNNTRITATASRLTFAGTELPAIVCNVTLTGTLRRLIAKTRGAEAGTIEADTVSGCTVIGGVATADALTEVGSGGPFRVQYNSLQGTLPTVTGGLIMIVGGFLILARTVIGSALCLYRGTIGGESLFNPIRGLRILESEIPRHRDLGGTIVCARSGSLHGSFALTPEVTIRLLES